jgi:hypothetical protein
MPKQLPRTLCLRKRQRQEWIVTIGEMDETVEFPSILAIGKDPLEAVSNLLKDYGMLPAAKRRAHASKKP